MVGTSTKEQSRILLIETIKIPNTFALTFSPRSLCEQAKSSSKQSWLPLPSLSSRQDSGHGLCHGMARLEAAMSMPTSMAGRFAERAHASRATLDEAAAEHARLCRAIVEDQAGACDEALGPSSADRAYLAMLNAEGVFSVMHGLQWWAEAPGGTHNQCGHMVAFEGEVRSRTGVPNLWRFDEPKEQLVPSE